jgi:NADH dehydrogenase
MKKVIIVGAGFAGLSAARELLGAKDLEITVVDKRNHHLFQPLLYQVAMAGLSPAEIATPIRSLLHHPRDEDQLRILMDEVLAVDLERRSVKLRERELNYDALLLACGASHSYFGNEAWEVYAPGLKSLEQATEIRRRVLLAFEEAEKESEAQKQKELLTFVVVGGGPTGVELAGALGEISRFTLTRDFSHIDPERTRIILIEAGPRILPSFSEEMSTRASRDLEKLGVTVWTSAKVTKIHGEGVELGAESLRARTVLWAAGVKASPLNALLGTELDRAGRVLVEKDLSLKSHKEVFVVGDQAAFLGPEGRALPGLAPVAMQEGRAAAKNILRVLRGEATQSFAYKDKGQMATIGRGKAVVETGRFKFGGFAAWVFWLLVHIYYLIGFKNRVFVLIQWTWSYLKYSRGARLIVNKEWREFKSPGEEGPR